MPPKIFGSNYCSIMLTALTLIFFFACDTDDGTLEDSTPPTVPVGLQVIHVKDRSIMFSWENSYDNVAVTGYVVYQNDTQVSIDSLNRHLATDLTPGTKYSYKIRAVDAAGNISGFSPAMETTTLKTTATPNLPDSEPTDTIAPSVPQNLVFSDITQTTANLTWDASTDNLSVVAYRIFRDTALLATVVDTEYSLTELTPDTEYSFTVSALDKSNNESGPSEVLTFSTEAMPPVTTDKILVFTKTVEFRHGSIPKGVATLAALGAANDFEVIRTEDAGDFTVENLQQYQTVVFLSTTGDVLNGTQQTALEQYIQAGGSFMGIHSATDTEYDWAWYGQLVGAYFDGHPTIQQARIDVQDAEHRSTSQLPDPWTRTDEWYNFRNINPNINVLLNLDESSYNGGTNGAEHPIAWYHEFGGGRSFYTAGGHSDANFDEPDFQEHLLGGILYCLKR